MTGSTVRRIAAMIAFVMIFTVSCNAVGVPGGMLPFGADGPETGAGASG